MRCLTTTCGTICAVAAMLPLCFSQNVLPSRETQPSSQSTTRPASAVPTQAGVSGIELDRALFQERKKDPWEFARLQWAHGVSYTETRALFDASHLPQFHKMLSDPDYHLYWGNISKVIAFIGVGRNQAESVPVMLDYFRRPEKWEEFDVRSLVGPTGSKINALSYVGLIGDNSIEPLLLKALTREGALDIAREWIDGPPPFYYAGKREKAVELVQGRAAMGLIFLRSTEGIAAVERMYREIDPDAEQRKIKYQLYDGLISALAVRDLITEIGIDEYLKTWGTTRGEMPKLMPYLKKYDAYFRNQPVPVGQRSN